MISEESAEEEAESDNSFHTFECTESNKKSHFEKMAEYMSHMIPILEMMANHTESVGDEHKEHKKDIKAIVNHFKNYDQTKEELRVKCDDSNTPIEDCCREIKALEKKFHDEMSSLNSEEHAT